MLRKRPSSGISSERRPSEKTASFSLDDEELGTASIKITRPTEDNIIDIYFGFMQVFHRYSINLCFPVSYCGSTMTCETAAAGLKIKEISENGKTATLVAEYLPPDNKVGSIIEQLKIKSQANNKELQARIHIDVLGRSQGRPSLKEGVTCIEVLPEFNMAESEWTPSWSNTSQVIASSHH